MANVVARDVVPGWDLIQSYPGLALYELRKVGSRYNLKWRGRCLPKRLATNDAYWNQLADVWATVSFRSDGALKAATVQMGGDPNGQWWRRLYDLLGEAMQ